MKSQRNVQDSFCTVTYTIKFPKNPCFQGVKLKTTQSVLRQIPNYQTPKNKSRKETGTISSFPSSLLWGSEVGRVCWSAGPQPDLPSPRQFLPLSVRRPLSPTSSLESCDPEPSGNSKFYSMPVSGTHLFPSHKGTVASPLLSRVSVCVCVFQFHMCPGNHKQIQVTKKKERKKLVYS